ncbi:MAG TPA: efflux RND transporter permease subunit [bacterium]|nr:efflux RND transporter permease subunit [bacterium]
MFLSDASVRRPIAMLCLIIAFTFLGLNSYRKMGLEMLPKMSAPVITIMTIYPGAGPEELEVDVAKRIEDKVVTIEGLKHVTSTCSDNVVLTFLEFNQDVNVNTASTDVREKIGLIRNDFPAAVKEPIILKYDVNATPVLTMALTGDAPLDELYDYAANKLSDKITVIKGVAETQVIGGAQREIHVLLNRDALASRGLASMNVVQAIAQGTGVIPSGRIKETDSEYSVKYDGDFKEVPDIGGIEIANENGQRSYLHDFAKVEMSTKELRQTASFNGHPCIVIKVVKKADANAVEVIRGVRGAMADLEKTLPGGMKLNWVADDETFTKANVDSAWVDVVLGIVFTALILFFFLYSIPATIIVAITMPLTIVIGLFFMQFLGYTLNISTMIAVAMSVGILVMDSILVIESIITHLKQTGEVKASVRLGAAEAFIPVLACAGTHLVVLFPIAMMNNRVGMFLKPLALTMAIMTIASLFISFTLTPILCLYLLKPFKEGRASLLGKLEHGWNSAFGKMVGGYGGFLEFNRKHRIAAALFMTAVIGLFLFTMSYGKKLGMGFVPNFDKGQAIVKLEFPTNYNISMTQKRVAQVEKILRKTPGLKDILVTIGKAEGVAGQNTEGVFLAQILLIFPDKTDREKTIFTITDEIKTKLKGMPDCITSVYVPLILGGQSSDIELEIYGDDLKTLENIALKTKEIAAGIKEITNLDTTVRAGKPEIRITPNRAVLADLGAPSAGLGLTLRGNLEGITASTFKKGDRNYDIVVKFDEEPGKEQIKDFQLPGAPGHPLLISSVANINEKVSPVQIIRKDKQRISKFTAALKGNAALGAIADGLAAKVKKSGIMPLGYSQKFGLMYETMMEGQRGIAEAGIIAIILIILILAAILESFKQPFLILLTIPLAMIGVVWGLFFAHMSFSIFVTMGIVMMTGIVVSNAILIRDQFNVNQKKGMPRQRAMVEAGKESFRPVVMITLAAIIGMAPLAFSKEIGSEFRNDIGIALIGGILVSGILSQLVIPILYNLFSKTDKPEDPEVMKKSYNGIDQEA